MVCFSCHALADCVITFDVSPVLADQIVHQVFDLVGLAMQHYKLLQVIEVFGLQQLLVLSILVDKSQHGLSNLRSHEGCNKRK